MATTTPFSSLHALSLLQSAARSCPARNSDGLTQRLGWLEAAFHCKKGLATPDSGPVCCCTQSSAPVTRALVTRASVLHCVLQQSVLLCQKRNVQTPSVGRWLAPAQVLTVLSLQLQHVMLAKMCWVPLYGGFWLNVRLWHTQMSACGPTCSHQLVTQEDQSQVQTLSS